MGSVESTIEFPANPKKANCFPITFDERMREFVKKLAQGPESTLVSRLG
jgi:hypothetical protein